MKRLYGKRAKYSWIITLTTHYRIFELISKNNLPILFIPECENPCQSGYFYCHQTLFLTDVVPPFDVESGNWYIVQEDDESDLYSYIEAEKENFQKCTGFNENIKCERVVFLVKENEFYDEEKDLIEDLDFILMYNKRNLAERINEFLSK